jgi:hypothetical protein
LANSMQEQSHRNNSKKWWSSSQLTLTQRPHLIQASFDTFLLAIIPPSPSIYPPNVSWCALPTRDIVLLSITAPTADAVDEMTPNQAHESSPMVWGWRLCTWFGRPQATCHGMGQSRSAPWLTPNMSNNLFARGCFGPGTNVRRIP